MRHKSSWLVAAGLMLALPGQASAACHVTLKVKGGAGGAGLTVGMSLNLVAQATGCGDVRLQIYKVRINRLGHRVGSPTHHACDNPCRIRDRRTSEGGYEYQVVVTRHGRKYRSGIVRAYWVASSSGSGGGGGGSGGTGGGGSGGTGGGGTAKVTCTLTGTDVNNTHPTELTVNASGMSADFKAASGGLWQSHYEWTIPTSFVAGDPSSGLTITGTIHDVNPDQDITDYYDIRAPDFKQQVQNSYKKGMGSHPEKGSWPYTLSASTAAGSTFDVIVDIISSEVIYHYKCA